MYVTYFAYPLPIDERLGCISLLSVVNGAGMNIHVQVSVGVPTGNSFGYGPRSSFASSYVNFNFEECLNCFPHWPHYLPFSPARYRVPVSPRLPTTC